MKNGIAYKNLTDSIVLIGAIIALICVLLSVVSFDKPYTVTDPETRQDIDVTEPLEDPYNITYLKLFVTFAITAMIGFLSRKMSVIPLIASICSILISLAYFREGAVEDYGFLYVLIGVVGLAGNIIYTVLMAEEIKAEFKRIIKVKRMERLAAEGKMKEK